jgi:hypothetical protein
MTQKSAVLIYLVVLRRSDDGVMLAASLMQFVLIFKKRCKTEGEDGLKFKKKDQDAEEDEG